jgi:hypothetical protein
MAASLPAILMCIQIKSMYMRCGIPFDLEIHIISCSKLQLWCWEGNNFSMREIWNSDFSR